MIGGSYVPGRWVAAVGEKTWLLADIGEAVDRVGPLWEMIERGAGHLELLGVLTKEGLAAAPSFVLVCTGDDRTVAVIRGAGSARLFAADVERVVDAAGTDSWAEYALPGRATKAELWVGDGAANGPSFPLGRGVVRADRLTLGTQATTTSISSEPPASMVTAERTTTEAQQTTEAASSEPPSQTLVYAPPQDELEVIGEPALSDGGDIAAAAEPGADNASAGYDHLFGMTINRNVEEAAIRELDTPLAPEPAAAPHPAQDPAEVAEIPEQVDPEPTHAVAIVAPPSTGLIDSVPWADPALARPSAPAAPAPSEVQVVREPDPLPDESDDAEGLTVSRASIQDQLRQGGEGLSPTGPTVQATRCPNGHANPTHLVSCRACHADIPEQLPITVPRPALGVLRMSTGDSISLDRGVIMGRSPTADRSASGDRPHLVKVPSPGKDISRNHLEVKLDGWHVLVTDLNSVNGTTVTLPGRSTERLRPDQPAAIEPGTVVSLADEVTFTFEVIQ